MITSSLKDKIQADLKSALRQKAELSVSVLRLILSEVHNREIEKRKALLDDEVQSLLAQSVKRHQDSIDQFQKGGRADLAAKEEAEQKIITSYLPPAMPPAELEALVKAAVAEARAANASVNLGAVMKILMPEVKGRASGQAVSELVKQELSK